MMGRVMAGGSHEEGRQRGASRAVGQADGEELVPWGGVEEDVRKADMVAVGGHQPGEGRRTLSAIARVWIQVMSCVLNKTAQRARNGYSLSPHPPSEAFICP